MTRFSHPTGRCAGGHGLRPGRSTIHRAPHTPVVFTAAVKEFYESHLCPVVNAKIMRSVLTIMLITFLIVPVTLSVEDDTMATLPVIPRPAFLQVNKDTFELGDHISIRYSSPDLRFEAEYLKDYLQRMYHLAPRLEESDKPPASGILLSLSTIPDRPAEGYSLHADNNGIAIIGDRPGVFYGIQTLMQILPADDQKGLKIPSVDITDYPRFPWRGMHLDVCRHFFPVEFVKRYISLLAMYKMNTFHWHLTEDQGWRIEIKKYPRLTRVGAYRNGSMIGPYSAQKFDSVRYGGFYTQDEIREVVAYAAKLHVTIVPEIEMPGHCLAALASYPELSCTGGPFEVGRAWGVYDDVYCTKDETFDFLQNVLSEVCDLFPGKYIHIGGDEVPKVRWKNCPRCQATMRREHLKDENELESYFVRRIEKFLNSRGKQIIGWDEILEGGLAPNAAVMSWRGTEGGISAAKMKHHVIMTPGGYCYFDYYQGNPQSEPLAMGSYTPVEKVYSYEPVPAELQPDEEHYILGAQGNVWTEYIPTPEQVEYMALPRMAALAEVDWTPKDERSYADFRDRLLHHFPLLDRLGFHYSKAIFDISMSVMRARNNPGIEVALSSVIDSSGIRYTIDGSEPAESSFPYHGPIPVSGNLTLKCAFIRNHQRVGNVLTQPFVVSKSTGRNITLKNQPHENYPASGAFTLVDGMRGDTTRFAQDWLGFWGPDLDATIDLGSPTGFSTVTMDFFDAPESWIYLPRSVQVFVSDDSLKWSSVKKIGGEDLRNLNRVVSLSLGRQTARYVRVVAENAGKIPVGSPGEGNAAWLFVDEIIIE